MSEISRLPFIPTAEMDRILSRTGEWSYQVEVRRPDEETWTDLSDVAGGDWVLSVQDNPAALGPGYQVDQPVGRFTVAFLARADGRTLSPGISAEPLNMDASAAFAPLLYPGNYLRIRSGNATPGGSPTMRQWLTGRVEDVEWPENDVLAYVSTPDAELERAWVKSEGELRGADYPGVPLQDEIADLLSEWGPDGISLRVLPDDSFPEYAEIGVGKYFTDRREVGPFLRERAQSMGADLRYVWDEDAGDVSYTLYLPPRDRTTPHLQLGPDQIEVVPLLRVSREFVRNDFEIQYLSAATEKRETLRTRNDASAEQFGEAYMFLGEADGSTINTESAATNLLAYAEHDLSQPPTTKRIRIPFCPWITLHDVLGVDPDDARFDYQTTWSVTAVRHEVTAEDAHTELDLRGGSPVGMYLGWHTRPQRPDDPALEYGLIDFREMAPSVPGNRRWGWTRRGRQVGEVWFGYKAFPAPWNEDYWPQVAALVVPLPDDQDWIELTPEQLPDASQVGALWVEPRLASTGQVYEDANVVERVKIDPVAASLDVTLTAAIVANAVDLTLTVTQAAGAKVYPATARIYEDGESGALIATIPLTADGTKAKADVSALGARTLPAEGKRTWAVVVTDVAGNTYRDVVEASALGKPSFVAVDTRISPTNLRAVDLFATVIDPQPKQGGTLEWWFPAIDEEAGTVTPADSSAAATGSRIVTAEEIAGGSVSFDPIDPEAWSGIPTTGAETLTLFLKYTSGDGRTTGAQPFVLKGSLGALIDLTNRFRAGSIDRALVLAEAFRPFAFATAVQLAGTSPEDWGTNLAFDATAGVEQAYRYNEGTGAWDPFTPTATHAMIPIFQAGVITTTLLDAEAVTGTILAGDSVEGRHMAAIVMEVGKYIHSSNYVTGISGWAMEDDLAEFNDVIVRGTLDGADGNFSGHLTASEIGVAGDLDFGFFGALSSAVGLKWQNVLLTQASILSDGVDIDLVAQSVNINGDLDVSEDINCLDIFCDDISCDQLNGVDLTGLAAGINDSGGAGRRLLTLPNV